MVFTFDRNLNLAGIAAYRDIDRWYASAEKHYQRFPKKTFPIRSYGRHIGI